MRGDPNGGTLQIKIMQAKLTRNTELIGEMDPYIVVKLNKIKVQTRVIRNGGLNPIWNETFSMPVTNIKDLLILKCFDKDFFIDDVVGEGVVQLCNIRNEETIGWIPIEYEGERAGHIQIETKLIRNSVNSQGFFERSLEEETIKNH